jgi:hypothetical protein
MPPLPPNLHTLQLTDGIISVSDKLDCITRLTRLELHDVALHCCLSDFLRLSLVLSPHCQGRIFCAGVNGPFCKTVTAALCLMPATGCRWVPTPDWESPLSVQPICAECLDRPGPAIFRADCFDPIADSAFNGLDMIYLRNSREASWTW